MPKPGTARFRVGTESRSTLREVLAGPKRLYTGFSGLVAGIAATGVPTRQATVPLRLACGRFVDWYRES